jgi:DNA-binding protein Fis
VGAAAVKDCAFPAGDKPWPDLGGTGRFATAVLGRLELIAHGTAAYLHGARREQRQFMKDSSHGDVSDISESEERGVVKDQLEALIMQMYKSGITYSEAVCEFKKRFILTVLQDCKGNQCKAARQLGMHRNTLSRTIAELKLDAKGLRAGTRRPPRSTHNVPTDKRAAR